MNKWVSITLLLAFTMNSDSASRRLRRKLTMNQQPQAQTMGEDRNFEIDGLLQSGTPSADCGLPKLPWAEWSKHQHHYIVNQEKYKCNCCCCQCKVSKAIDDDCKCDGCYCCGCCECCKSE